MAVPFVASNEFLNPATALDLTASPKLALTNSSTFTVASNLATVAANEVSTGGYARINLSVLSNSVQPGGDYKLIYDLAQITPSGGSITFDRVVLVIGSNWAGYWEYGTTTIASGQTYPFRGMTIQRTDQGTLVNGQNGLPAWTTTSASFVHPAAVGGTVSATVGQTSFMAVGSYLFFDDGVSQTQYKITAIGSATNVTLQRTTDEVTGGTTMQAGGTLVPSGKNGTDGFGLLFVFNSTTTTPPSSGQLRFNNAAPGSVTAIYASETDRNTTNISSILNGLNAGSQLLITDDSDPTAWALYNLNSRTDSGTYSTLTVTYVGHFGTLSDNVVMSFANKGATGATGATGAAGADGLGWTGGSYNAGTGIVTFTSDDGLGFATGDLRGAAGADGITGFGLKYTFSATTTSPPNSGEVRLNNALPASATSIFIHETDRDSNDVASVLALLTAGSLVEVLDESDPTAYAIYSISSNTDNGTDVTLGVTAEAIGAGSFSGDVVLAFSIKGATGATGSAGANGADGTTGFGLEYTFSATTTSPPSSGELRFNNAFPGSATSIYVSETDRNTNNVASVLSALSVGSFLLVRDENDNTAYALYTISSNTDNGTDRTIGVTAIAAGVGTFSGSVLLTFAMKGDTGATGSVSAASTLTFTESTEPSTPSANNLVLYVDTVDGLLKQKTDAGLVTTVGAGGGASIRDVWLHGGV